jgi:tRNA pseudouridine55 synthase
LSDKDIEEKIATLVGEQEIAVPVYSAIKQDGKALYKYARKDQEVEVPVKTMTVHSAELKNIRRDGSEIYLEVTFDVGSGTYIRSLARELGERLGVPGTLSALRRTSIGEYKAEDARAISTEEIKGL